jgi:caffeoyl-CoA O-methyltransferase
VERKVVDETALQKDKDTQSLDAFNRHIAQDERIEKILLPIRDGLTLCRKK